jgi:hypothetical protein
MGDVCESDCDPASAAFFCKVAGCGFVVNDVVEEPDGGYLLAGDRAPGRTDECGELQQVWSDLDYGVYNGAYCGITEAHDSGFVVIGWRIGSGGYKAIAAKLLSDGTVDWLSQVSSGDGCWGLDLTRSSSGGYFCVGYCYDANEDMMVWRIEGDGTSYPLVTWDSLSSAERLYSVVEDRHGNLVAAGWRYTSQLVKNVGVGIVFDAQGAILRELNWDGPGKCTDDRSMPNRTFHSVDTTGEAEQHYVFAGQYLHNVVVVKTDTDLNIVDEYVYDAIESFGHSINTVADGGFVVAGNAGSDLLILKLDADLDLVWDTTLVGPSGGDGARAVIQAKDGAYVVGGMRYGRAFLLKLPAQSCCQIRGDINHSAAGPDISDLVYLMTFMFQSGPEPPCLEEADANGSGGVDISDLVYLVSYMFQGGPPPVPCD